jgi:hypothetical protein
MSRRAAIAGTLLLAAVSCGGAPTLTSLQQSIFTPKCAVPGCHSAPAPEQGMNLSAGQMFLNTVNVNVVELPGFVRVAPNDSANSYLYMKITADPRIVGAQMPFGELPLSSADVAAVKAWIDAGALNN